MSGQTRSTDSGDTKAGEHPLDEFMNGLTKTNRPLSSGPTCQRCSDYVWTCPGIRPPYNICDSCSADGLSPSDCVPVKKKNQKKDRQSQSQSTAGAGSSTQLYPGVYASDVSPHTDTNDTQLWGVGPTQYPYTSFSPGFNAGDGSFGSTYQASNQALPAPLDVLMEEDEEAPGRSENSGRRSKRKGKKGK